MKFEKVDYKKLNDKQKEVYNFHLVAALLAAHGFATYPVRDDWNGADMLARHMIRGDMLAIQMKTRITFAKKYLGKDLWIGFPMSTGAFVYPHDALLTQWQAHNPMTHNDAWQVKGEVHWPQPTQHQMSLLKPYRLDP